jgi:putative addiction module killer protein
MDYNAAAMTEVRQTPEFSAWLNRLRRQCGRAHSCPHSPHGKGNPGDGRSVGGSILEMRVDYGPGYRIYYVHRGAQIVILLCGGDKRRQQQNIKRAQTLAETI